MLDLSMLAPYLPLITAVASLGLAALHTRGYKLPIIEGLLEAVLGIKAGGATTPAAAPSHPILDAVRAILPKLPQPQPPTAALVEANGQTQLVVTVPGAGAPAK